MGARRTAALRERPVSDAAETDRVERFCKTTRWFHWTFALSFLSLAATGAILFLRESFDLSPEQAGDLEEAHLLIGWFFLIVPWLIGLSGDTRRWLSDLSECTRISRSDFLWLARQPLAMFGEVELPPQGKLNAGQKLNALAVAVLGGALVGSGLHLWSDRGAFAALMIHIGAFLAWIPAFGVHLFMAVVNPATRPALGGMLSGRVSRKWAEHHHGLWVASLKERRRA
jgi:formate dehydrogenase subunit gamma